MKKSEKIELIETYLDELYPDAKCELNFNNDFELLIAVVLSAQTTDVKVNGVTKELFKLYPTCFKLAKARYNNVESIVRPLGLYRHKAKSIIELSKIISEKYDGIVPNDREILESLPGVGRKTCNVVLNNAFNVPAFAVDTHVSRVSRRLGIAKYDDDVLEIEQKLMKAFPKEKWGKLHHQFIFFGRYKCKAINPLCDDCKLKDICK